MNPTCERILEKECGCLLVRYVVSNTWSSRTEVDCSTFKQTKVVQTCGVLYILTFKCAFRHSGVQLFDSRTSKSAPKTTVFFNILTGKCAFHHSGVQFFDICTSESGPNTSCLAHFDLNMCFSRQWRAILRHLNFKKCFGADVFCTFSLQNVLFATAACNF